MLSSFILALVNRGDFVLTTLEAEIDVNGSVTLLKPLPVSRKSRVLITLLDNEIAENPATRITEPEAELEKERDLRRRRMAWLKANREEYGGQYVVLDGDRLLGVAQNYPAGRRIAQQANVPNAFVAYLSKPDEMGYLGGWP